MTSPLIEAMARAIDPEIWSDTFLDVGRMNRVRRESLDRAQAALKAISESGPTVEMIEAGAKCDRRMFESSSEEVAPEVFRVMIQAAMLSALPDTGGE